MKGLPYKNTFAAKGSELYRILTEEKEPERSQKAKACYEATTLRMLALVPKEVGYAASR